MSKVAVIGAGKTGRGFLARLLKEDGAEIVFIDKNEKLHMVLYEEDGCVKANDLDTCWIVFSPQNQLNTYKYQLDIDDKGMHVIAKIENIV